MILGDIQVFYFDLIWANFCLRSVFEPIGRFQTFINYYIISSVIS